MNDESPLRPFDTRIISDLPWVSVIRDGYYFIKKVGDNEKD